MAKLVNLTLTSIGNQNGTSFAIYTDADSYASPVASAVTASDLLAGYAVSVPNAATLLKVSGSATCGLQPVAGISITSLIATATPTPTPTPTPVIVVTPTFTPTPTATATPTPTPTPAYISVGTFNRIAGGSCAIPGTLEIFLDSTDYPKYLANSNCFNNTGFNTSDIKIRDIAGNTYDNIFFTDACGVSWKVIFGALQYNALQC